MRGLRNTELELRVELTDVDGKAADADADPTITVRRDSDGTAVATDAATAKVDDETGIYSFSLTPAQTAEVELFHAEWTATIDGTAGQIFRTDAEAVGGYLCSLGAIAGEVADGTPTATLREARDWAEDILEQECGAMRARYAAENLTPYTASLLLSHTPVQRLLAVTNGSAGALDAGQLASLQLGPAGDLTGAAWTTTGVRVAYVYGEDRPPAPISRAAVQLAKFYIDEAPSDYDQRATRIDTEEASYQLVTAGVREAITSLPEVNAAIAQFGRSGSPLF
jgi:hypothetical protein